MTGKNSWDVPGAGRKRLSVAASAIIRELEARSSPIRNGPNPVV